MIVVGIDQSMTSTGVCFLDSDDVSLLYAEVIGTSPNKEDVLDKFHRFVDISTRLVEVIKKNPPGVIVIEDLAFGSFGDATRNLAALQGVLVCDILKTFDGCKVVLVPPTALKKFATGSGKAKKKDMLEAVPTVFREFFDSVKVKDGKYDIVDAYHLAKWGIENDC